MKAVLPILLVLPLCLLAQNNRPSGIPALPGSAANGGGAGQGTPQMPAAGNSQVSGINVNGGNFDPNAAGAQADRIWNVDSDSIDAENGTFTWKGRTFNLGNSRAARARFERYLAMPPLAEEEAAYLDLLARIKELLLQVQVVDGQMEVKDGSDIDDHIYQAWQLLFEASQYQMDNNTCIVVVQVTGHNGRAVNVGLIVDSVDEVFNITGSEVEPAPDLGTETFGLLGIAKTNDQVRTLLDTDQIVGVQEVVDISHAAA